MNTIRCLSKEECTGCGACVNRCPADCISMQRDKGGFFQPVIDAGLCSGCGICKTVCPVLHPPSVNNAILPICYAAWSKDPSIRLQSTSGGIFTHLAQAVLAREGVVIGARYRADHLVEHAAVVSENELGELRQSKYVQSETGLIYRTVEIYLKQGRELLFSGTPCQCAGLQVYLGRCYENLYLVDFICRGVNSPAVYQAYLRELEQRYRAPVKRVWFKNKAFGWNHFSTKIVFENGQEYLEDRETDPFMLGYIKSRLNLYMRPSCYQCKFKGLQRPVDITLGDFWGVQFESTDMNSGVSAVLLHSEKGRQLFNVASPQLHYEEHGTGELLRGNPCLVENADLTPLRTHFWNSFLKGKAPFSKVILSFQK